MYRQLISNWIARFSPWLGDPNDLQKSMLHGTGEALALRVFGTGLGFGFNVFLARVLGAQGLGVYYLALSIITTATVIGRFGLDNFVVRITAASASQQDWDSLAGAYRKSMQIAITVSLAVTLAIWVSAPWLAYRIFGEESLTKPLQWLALGITPTSLLLLHGEMLRGLERIRAAVLLQAVGVPLVNIPLFIFAGLSSGVLGLAITNVVSTILILILGIFVWRQATPNVRGVKGHFSTRLMVDSSLPLLWIAVMNMVISSADTVALGIWTGSSAVGIFGVVRRTSLITSFILVAVNTIAAPKFAALYAAGDHTTLGYTARSTTRLMTLFALPFLLIFIMFPELILGIFGSTFATGGPSLRILAAGDFVNVATGSVGLLLMMTGHEKPLRNIVFASMLLDVALQVLLVPAYGLAGAAWASALTLAVQNIMVAALAYFKLSIVTLPLPEALFHHGR